MWRRRNSCLISYRQEIIFNKSDRPCTRLLSCVRKNLIRYRYASPSSPVMFSLSPHLPTIYFILDDRNDHLVDSALHFTASNLKCLMHAEGRPGGVAESFINSSWSWQGFAVDQIMAIFSGFLILSVRTCCEVLCPGINMNSGFA